MENKQIAFYLAGKNDFPLTVRKMDTQNATVVLHSHNFVELVCVYGGKGTHLLDGESFPIASGSVFIIPQGILHGFEVTAKSSLRLYNILFLPEKLPLNNLELSHLPGFKQLFMPLRNSPVHHFDIGEKNMSEITALLEQFIQEDEARLPGSKSCRMALMTLVMNKLIRFYPGDLLPETKERDIIRQVQEYLNSHPADDCSIKRLTKIARMSRSNLLKLFKNATGVSPHRYQLQRQLDKACTALKETSLPIAEIAGNCGFTDTNYFSRLFHKYIGNSPREYRKNLLWQDNF